MSTTSVSRAPSSPNSAAISLFNYVLNMILLLVFNQGAKRAGQTSLF